MVAIKKITVKNIRSHKDTSILLSPKVTAITGVNGSGKTSILESIYITLQGTSFKGTDFGILNSDASWWRIESEFDSGKKRLITFDSSLDSKRKKITIDDRIASRLMQKNKHPVILFEPDDLQLLSGSPNRRRQFIDRLISQLDPVYFNAIHKYDRALKQRNNLLKKDYFSKDEIFVWDVALSDYGAYIIEKRIVYVEKINQKLNEVYKNIAGNNDIVSIHYSNTFIGDVRQKILNDLNLHFNKDRVLGSTSVGPHRHDIVFSFNNSPALEVASRGEVRSIILALKFIEVGIVEQITNQKPIVLLDDVFSELDFNRQRLLINTMQPYQTIITSTDIPPGGDDFKHIKLN